ncbi:unnamed protein product [Heterobilharzia americana]|nr:unnamed protein product [Heterobilharzia americana]
MVSGIQTIDTNHEDMIHDAQLDYYGTTLATASSDHSVKIFDVRNKKQLLVAHLREHQGPVWSLSWSHPIYYLERSQRTMGKVYEYAEHDSSVNCVCWAPHSYGLMLACASSDGTISILVSDETNTWRAFRITDAHSVGVNSVSWAPSINAEFIFNPSATNGINPPIKRLVSGGCDSLIKIWREDITSGSPEWIEEARLDGHTDWVRDVAWCPSLNISRQLIASCGQDGRLIIWQSSNETENRLNTSVTNNPNSSGIESKDYSSKPYWRPTVLYTYSDVVWNVSWSVTGNILAVSGGDNKVTLWKENLEGNWIALSEIARGHGASSLIGAEENSQTSNQSTAQIAT